MYAKSLSIPIRSDLQFHKLLKTNNFLKVLSISKNKLELKFQKRFVHYFSVTMCCLESFHLVAFPDRTKNVHARKFTQLKSTIIHNEHNGGRNLKI